MCGDTMKKVEVLLRVDGVKVTIPEEDIETFKILALSIPPCVDPYTKEDLFGNQSAITDGDLNKPVSITWNATYSGYEYINHFEEGDLTLTTLLSGAQLIKWGGYGVDDTYNYQSMAIPPGGVVKIGNGNVFRDAIDLYYLACAGDGVEIEVLDESGTQTFIKQYSGVGVWKRVYESISNYGQKGTLYIRALSTNTYYIFIDAIRLIPIVY